MRPASYKGIGSKQWTGQIPSLSSLQASPTAHFVHVVPIARSFTFRRIAHGCPWADRLNEYPTTPPQELISRQALPSRVRAVNQMATTRQDGLTVRQRGIPVRQDGLTLEKIGRLIRLGTIQQLESCTARGNSSRTHLKR